MLRLIQHRTQARCLRYFLPDRLILALSIAYTKFKRPEESEASLGENFSDNHLSNTFWLYVLFVLITAAGFISFALVGFHLKKRGIASDVVIALLYATAMAIDAIFGLFAGRMYDGMKTNSRHKNGGLFILLAIPLLSALVPFLVFSSTLVLIIIGIMLFGLVVGVQETILKAVVADMTPMKGRSMVYEIFNDSYGLAFLIGSSLAGLFYDYSIVLLAASFAVIELMAVPVFLK